MDRLKTVYTKVNVGIEVGNSVYVIIKEAPDKAKSWKSKLSGVLNEQQIFFSLMVIGLFYIAYGITNFSFGDNRNEDFITRNCHCQFWHRFLYRVWFSISFAMWFCLYTYTFFVQSSKVISCPECIKKRFSSNEGCCKRIKDCFKNIKDCCGYCFKWIVDLLKSCLGICNCFQKCKCCNGTKPNNKDSSNGGQKELVIEAKIQQQWFYYYKLYVTGFKRDDKDWQIDMRSKEEDQSNPNPPQASPTGAQQNETDTSTCDSCCSCSGCLWYYVIYSFFLIVKYIAQLATVPLILMQIFDTYSLLCFFPNEAYCTPTSEYRIHAIQSILTVSFYCSLALSLLASTILEWNPWPKSFTEERYCKCD